MYVTYGPGSHRGLSGNLWGNCPMLDPIASQSASPDDPSGFFVFDNFLSCSYIFDADLSSTIGYLMGDAGGYTTYQDSSTTIATLSTTAGGVLELATPATDNTEVWAQFGSLTSVLGSLDNTAGNAGNKKTWFECRINTDQIASGNIFAGLAQQGAGTADFLTDSNAFADVDYIGFSSVHGTPTALDFGYNKASGTDQVLISGAHTLVADTFVKCGFFFDPTAPASKRCKVFINNTEQSTYLTGTLMDDSTNFPGGEEMTFLFGAKAGTTTAKKHRCDWWAFAQEW